MMRFLAIVSMALVATSSAQDVNVTNMKIKALVSKVEKHCVKPVSPKQAMVCNAIHALEQEARLGNWVDQACQFLEAANQALHAYCDEAPSSDPLCNGQVAGIIAQLEQALQCQKNENAGMNVSAQVSDLVLKMEAHCNADTMVRFPSSEKRAAVCNAMKMMTVARQPKLGDWVDTACQFLQAANQALHAYCDEAPKSDALCNGQIAGLIAQLEQALQCNHEEKMTEAIVYV